MAENSSLDDDGMANTPLKGPMLDDGLANSSSSEELSPSLNKQISGLKISGEDQSNNADLHITCFTDESHDVTLHFQIITLAKQIYIWIGCNSAKLGHLYAGAPTRPNDTASVTSLLGGGADSTGAGIARRLVLRTGLNIILACNIPKNSPMLEAQAERILIQKLNDLGYSKDKQKRLSTFNAV